MSIDETFSAVMHKPTGHVCSGHSVCSIVLLKASAGKTGSMVRLGRPACLERRHSALMFFSPSQRHICSCPPILLPKPPPPIILLVLVLEGQRISIVSLDNSNNPLEIGHLYRLFQQGKECKLTFKWKESGKQMLNLCGRTSQVPC